MTQEPEKPPRFPPTRWSLVGRAGVSDELTRQRALAELLTTYTPGLRTFLMESRRIPADTADDILQSFIADRVLAGGLVRRADKRRGKFRNFVLKSLSNYAATYLKRDTALRARTVDLDDDLIPSTPGELSTDKFHQQWVIEVIRDALRLMEADRRKSGRIDMWEVFRLRVVEPALNGARPIDYEQIIGRYGLTTPRQAINLLANAKRVFLKQLKIAVSKYINDNDVEGEVLELRRIIGKWS